MRKLILAIAILAPFSANAALPPAAYEGDVWARLTGGFKCVGQHAVLPQFIRKDEPAGVYWYAVPGQAECVKGGAGAGPQF